MSEFLKPHQFAVESPCKPIQPSAQRTAHERFATADDWADSEGRPLELAALLATGKLTLAPNRDLIDEAGGVWTQAGIRGAYNNALYQHRARAAQPRARQ